jgi:hypothetical protein
MIAGERCHGVCPWPNRQSQIFRQIRGSRLAQFAVRGESRKSAAYRLAELTIWKWAHDNNRPVA